MLYMKLIADIISLMIMYQRFPGLTDGAINGIKVTRDSLTQITVSGAPTAKSTTIALADPMKKKLHPHRLLRLIM